ncbi:MAG: hypothetical protein M1831_005631 [Alyxoria varia]|nr:MAG: hypothetical protein M1831_005631 [Alyxoria varia]
MASQVPPLNALEIKALQQSGALAKTAEDALQDLKRACIALLVLTTLFALGRFYSRVWIGRIKLWWDDYTILIAYVCNVVICVIGLRIIHYETRNNPPAILPILNQDDLVPILKCIYVVEQFLMVGYTLTRISVLFIYLRAFTRRKIKILTWILMGLVNVNWVAFGIAGILQCWPVQFYWDRTIAGGTCVDIDRFYRSFSPPNIVIDILIIVLPIPAVWKLPISRLRKIGLTYVFGTGILALVASCIRYSVYMHTTAEVIAPTNTNTLFTWVIIEPGIYFIAACLPAMHHLCSYLTPKKLRIRLEALAYAANPPSTNPRLLQTTTLKSMDSTSSEKGFIVEEEQLAEPLPAFSERQRKNSRLGLEEEQEMSAISRFPDSKSRKYGGKGGADSAAARKIAKRNPKLAQLLDLENQTTEIPASIPLEELRQGNGIMVQTEITVTEEQRIHSIIGI